MNYENQAWLQIVATNNFRIFKQIQQIMNLNIDQRI